MPLFKKSWTPTNDGAGSGLDADLLDGLDVHTATNNEANKVVRTDASGYLQTGWINTISGDNGTTALTRIYASSDNYIRTYTPANFRTVLDVPTRTGTNASGTWAINVSGNAATATSVVNSVAGTGSVELVRGNMGDNDNARILVGATASNAGYLEIATADDGTEPIHVRQYTGTFGSLLRTATLLDESGNTSFPGNVGIGATAPLNQLNISGTGNYQVRVLNTTTAAASIHFTNNSGAFFLGIDNSAGNAIGGGSYSRLIWGQDAYPLAFGTNNAERMRITSAGNLLIGTSTDFTTTTSPGGAVVAGVGIYPYTLQSGLTNTSNYSSLNIENATAFTNGNGALSQSYFALSVTPKVTNSGVGGSNFLQVIGGSFIPVIQSSGTSGRIVSVAMLGNALRGSSSDTSTFTSNGLTGVYGNAGHLNTAAAGILSGTATGAIGQVSNQNGTITTLQGVRSLIFLASGTAALTASTTDAYGYQSEATVGAASGGPGTITNYYGYRSSLTVGVTGTISNYYAAFYGTPTVTGTITNRWGIYQQDAASPNVFAGQTSIGGLVGAESLRVTPVTSAVNYITIQGQTTGGLPAIFSAGSDTNIGMFYSTKGTGQHDFYTNVASAALQFRVAHTASAVNYLQVTGGATGSAVVISSNGSDTNVGMSYISKGAGQHFFYSNGSPQFNIGNTASAVNYLRVNGGATGSGATLSAQGTDTNINLILTPKGTGNVGIGTSTPGVKLDINGSARIANASPLYWFNYNSTANGPSITGGSDSLTVETGPGGPGRGALTLTGHNNTTLQTDAGFLSLSASQAASTEAYIRFSTAGTERMRILSTGNVGIGTSAPGAKLDISGDSLHLTETSANLDTFKVLVSSSGAGYSHTYLKGQAYTLATYANPQASNYTVNSNVYSAQSSGVISSLALVLGAGAAERVRITSAGNVGIGTTAPAYKLEVNGSFAATTKSFVIHHPTKPGKKLRYGSLEGPENGVYIRGKIKGKVIELPEYWTKLVDPDTITVQLTAFGKEQKLFVKDIKDNKVFIESAGLLSGDPYCFYFIQAERVDVDKLQVEID